MSAEVDQHAGESPPLELVSQDAVPPAAPASRIVPIVQGLLALAIYLAVWLVFGAAFPLLRHPGWAQLDQTGMDPNFYVWGLRWWPYAISHGLNPLHSALVVAPTGTSLAWTTTIPPLAVLVWPLTSAAGPIVSFNLLVAFSIPVSGWAAFVLCRRITGRFGAALAGGFVYGFSAYEISHIIAGQLNLSFGPLLPLMAYLVVVWLDKKINAIVFTLLMALALAAQFWLFLETFADLTVLLVLALIIGYLVAGRQHRPTVRKLAGLIGLAYLASLAAAAPYIDAALRAVPPGFQRSPDGMATDALNLVMARAGNGLGLSSLLPQYSPPWPHGGFVGIPLLAVALALAVLNWSSKTVRFLFITLVAVIAAALGPAIRVNGQPTFTFPWDRVWELPIVRSSFPSRIMVFAFLLLAVITAIWLAGPSRWQWLRWLVAWVGIVTIATNSTALSMRQQPGVPSFIMTGQYRQYLPPGSTVVVIATHTGNAGLLWQADTDFYFRLAGGYLNEAIAQSAYPLPVVELLSHGVNTPNVKQFRAFIKAANVSAILVQKGSAHLWYVVFARLLHMKHTYAGGVMLYRTSQISYSSPPASARRILPPTLLPGS